ncbi:MAG: hypothetical protein ACP5E5_05635 [Acidobacteriaceae bacterium]
MQGKNLARVCMQEQRSPVLTLALTLIVTLCSALAGATRTAAQSAPPGAQRALGAVKATSPTGFTLTTTSGQALAVNVPATAKVLVVPPGSKDLSSATQGTLSDVAVGDRALVTGNADAQGITALRVILMKAQAIAASHAAEAEAWQRGGGGIVKSVDSASGTILITSGLKTITVLISPQTSIRRYAPGSVRFADAMPSNLGEIQKGDQLLVRGAKSPDGSTITADVIVTGSFGNYSGLIASIDQQAGTISFKDLATHKNVTIAVTAKSDLRSLPMTIAERFAAQMRAANHLGGPAHQGPPQPGVPSAQSAAASRGRAGLDLSHMLSRLPAETLAGLKVGDAVMIVATLSANSQQTPQAVTLLAGVEPILRASPKGQSMTLSPWSPGGGGGGDEGGGAGGGPQQ